MQFIRIRGARTHNLRGLDLDIPRDRLVVITGLSGSGKSSLAFDTLYAEGQRRYVESLSAYARQFLSMMDKPDVDHIEGLSPSIAIEQKATSHNPRSTVGTVTEIYDYLRLLFARAGVPRCPDHGIELAAQATSQMVDQVLKLPEGTAALLLAPLIEDRKGEHAEVFENLQAQGFVRARIDGAVVSLDETFALPPDQLHPIDLVVDRVVVKPEARARILDAVELCLQRGDGFVCVAPVDGEERTYTARFACTRCGRVLPEVEPALIPGTHRVLNAHRNVPGVLRDINRIVSDHHANVLAQVLSTNSDIGYLIIDLDKPVTREVCEAMKKLDTTIRARALS